MEVYLIRHGESEANAAGVHSGWMPVHLTEKGRRQAAEAARLVGNISFDGVIVSDLVRALETAQIIFPDSVMTVRRDIREIDTSNISGKKVSELRETLGEVYARARANLDYGELGCEPQSAFLERVGGFMRWLETLSCDRVAVVCHAGVIHAMGAMALSLPLKSFSLPVFNSAVCVMSVQAGAWRILRWNCGKMGNDRTDRD